MSKHVTGPWVVSHRVEIRCPHEDNTVIARMEDSREAGWNTLTINANARLIAAAPEMLETLSNILHEVTHDIAGLPRDELLDVVSAVRDLAEAAIAKATV